MRLFVFRLATPFARRGKRFVLFENVFQNLVLRLVADRVERLPRAIFWEQLV